MDAVSLLKQNHKQVAALFESFEEEASLFPKLAEAGLDLNALGEALASRKAELMMQLGISAEAAVSEPATV